MFARLINIVKNIVIEKPIRYAGRQTEIVEMLDGIPVVQVYPYRRSPNDYVEFYCHYCKEYHWFPRRGLREEITKDKAVYKQAHCVKNTPFRGMGHYLLLYKD